MIPNIVIGKHLKEAVYYLLESKRKPKIVSESMVNTKNPQTIIEDFKLLANKNPNLKNFVCHISFSFSNEDNINEKNYESYLEEYINEMYENTKDSKKPIDFRNAQRIIISHGDTDHKHFHVLFNRTKLNPSKKNDIETINDSMIKRANKRVSFTIAEKHSWKLDKIKKWKAPLEDIYDKISTKKKYQDTPKKTILKNTVQPILQRALSEDSLDKFFDTLLKNDKIQLSPTSQNTAFNDLFFLYLSRKEIEKYNRWFFKNRKYYIVKNYLSFRLGEVSFLFEPKNIQSRYNLSEKMYNLITKKRTSKMPNKKINKIYETIENHQDIESLQRENITLPKHIKEKDIKLYYQIKRQKSNPIFYGYNHFKKDINYLKKVIKNIYENSFSLDVFEKKINAMNIELVKKKDEKGNFVGASFLYNNTKIPCSYVDYKLSAKNLIQKFNLSQLKITKNYKELQKTTKNY